MESNSIKPLWLGRATMKLEDNNKSEGEFNQASPMAHTKLPAATNQIAMFALKARTITTISRQPAVLFGPALLLALLGALSNLPACQASGAHQLIDFSSLALVGEHAQALPLVQGNQLASSSGAGERPRLIPLVAADSGYSENSSVNVLCTVSQGHHESLTFEWFKDGQLIGGDGHDHEQHQQLHSNAAPQIEKHQDHSLLRISRVQSHHSGRYSCAAKNQFGQDSSSVNLIVNVRMRWIKEPPRELVVSANQELKVDCLAEGEPKPSMRWEKLDSLVQGHSSSSLGANSKQRLMQAASLASGQHQAHGADPLPTSGAATRNQLASNLNGNKLAHHNHRGEPKSASSAAGLLVSSTRYLTIQRARESDSGLYECVASNSHDNDLRKLVHVQVRGPPKILPIATADSYPEGSSINLICTVSGGQRRGLSLSWTFNGDEMLDESGRRLRHSDSFDNVAISQDEADISILRIKNSTSKNSGQYACTAKNPLGQDSTSVKIVINVEMKWSKVPKDQVEVGINQEIALECDAQGSPQPIVEWFKHADKSSSQAELNGTRIVSNGKLLKISRAQHRDSGLYECVARNGADENLRKFVHLRVRGAPKILPIASADSYPEGATINLICTVSGGQRRGLTLGWFKDGQELNDELLRFSNGLDNLSIEKTGIDISILRITNATNSNSGRYGCKAVNPLGEDSTSVNILINVELKWNKLPVDSEVGLNQDLNIDCDASGQPQPQIQWIKLPSSAGFKTHNDTNKPVIASHGKTLKIAKAQHKDTGLYECIAKNGVDQDLRRVIQVKVREDNIQHKAAHKFTQYDAHPRDCELRGRKVVVKWQRMSQTRNSLNSILLGDELGQIKLVQLDPRHVNNRDTERFLNFNERSISPVHEKYSREELDELQERKGRTTGRSADYESQTLGSPHHGLGSQHRHKIVKIQADCLQREPAASRAITNIRPIQSVHELDLDTTDKSNNLFLITNRVGQIFVCDTNALRKKLRHCASLERQFERNYRDEFEEEEESAVESGPILSPIYYNMSNKVPVFGGQPINQTNILVVYQNGDVQHVNIGQDVLQSSLSIRRKAIRLLGLGYNSDARTVHWRIDGQTGICYFESDAATAHMDENDPLTEIVLSSPTHKLNKRRGIDRSQQSIYKKSPCIQSRKYNAEDRLVPTQVINMITSRTDQYKPSSRICKWSSITSLNLIFRKLALYDLVGSENFERAAQAPNPFHVNSYKLNDNRLAVGGTKYALRVFDVQTQKAIYNCRTGSSKNPLVCPARGEPVMVGDIDWLGGNKTTRKSPDMLATCSGIDSIVNVYDLRSAKPVFYIDLTHQTENKWQPYENYPRGCMFTSICASGAPYSTAVPSQQLALGSTNGQLHVIDLRFVARSNRTLGKLSGFCGGSVREIRFVSESFETSKMISCATDRFVRIHRIQTSFTSVISQKLATKVFLGTRPTCIQPVCDEVTQSYLSSLISHYGSESHISTMGSGSWSLL